MAFVIPAPAERHSQGLESAVNMLLRFQMHKASLVQDQKQFEEELEHRKLVSKKMTAHQAVQTNTLVRKTDAQADLFNAQTQNVQAKTKWESSSKAKMLKFLDAKSKAQAPITKAYYDALALNAPYMTIEDMREGQASMLASSMAGAGYGGMESTMESLLPYTRQLVSDQFNTQAAQDQRTAKEFIEQFKAFDKNDPDRDILQKSIGTLRRIAAGEQLPRQEIDRVFNAVQFNLNPEKKIDLPFWFTGSKPTRELTDDQLTQFQESGHGDLDEKRLMEFEGRQRGLPGFVPARSTRSLNQPRDPVFEQIGDDLSGVTTTLGRMGLSDSGRTPLIRTRKEYDNLPVGASYRDVDGNIGTKR